MACITFSYKLFSEDVKISKVKISIFIEFVEYLEWEIIAFRYFLIQYFQLKEQAWSLSRNCMKQFKLSGKN